MAKFDMSKMTVGPYQGRWWCVFNQYGLPLCNYSYRTEAEAQRVFDVLSDGGELTDVGTLVTREELDAIATKIHTANVQDTMDCATTFTGHVPNSREWPE